MSKETSAPLPSIQDVASKILSSSQAKDPAIGTGGTTSDPSITAAQVVAAAEPAPAEVKATPEVAPEKVEKKEPVKDPASSRFGALARKEKEIRQRQADADARLKAADDREKAIKAREEGIQRANKNPLQILKEYGFSYQDATQAVLGGFEEAPEDPMDAKLKPYKEQFDKFSSNTEKLQAELDALRNELTTNKQRESMAQVTNEINTTLKDEKFELTKAMGEDGVDFVREIMIEYYNANKSLLDYAEACQLAEDYYEKEYLGRLLETKKLKSRLPQQAVQATPAKKPEAKPTLTNGLATGGGATVDVDTMSREDAIAYLSKKLQFKQN